MRQRIKELRWVDAAMLAPDERNWRKHPKAQRSALQAMLDSVGIADAVIARETAQGLVLVDGHLRQDMLKGEQVPVLIVDLDEYEAGQVLATLDPLAAMAEANVDALQALITATNAPVDWDAVMPEQPDVGQLDDAPEPPAEPITQRGDVWTLGRHRLGCGDSTTDFGLLGDASGGLVLTDPPYGLDIVKNGRQAQAGNLGGYSGRTGFIGGSKPFGSAPPTGTVGGAVVKPRAYIPIQEDDKPFAPDWLLSLGAAQVIFGAQYFCASLPDGNHAWLCWDKGIGEESTFSGFEVAWTSFKGRARMYRHRWSGMVREGSRALELKDRFHPTQKPVGLMRQILDDIGSPYDLVLDPYAGSSSVLMAAEVCQRPRTCYAMELEPRYVDAAVKRWEAYTGQQAVRS